MTVIYIGIAILVCLVTELFYCNILKTSAIVLLVWSILLESLDLDNIQSFLSFILIGTTILLLLVIEKKELEYITMVLLFVWSNLLMLKSSDFLTLYLSLELGSFVSYILVSSKKEKIESTEAGLKYFILGSFASMILLLGIVLLYSETGTVNFIDVFLLEDMKGVRIGLIFVLVGILFKLGAAPFHFWVPDVYEGSEWDVLVLLGSVSKLGIYGVLVNICYNTISMEFEYISLILFVSGSLSIVIGSLGAFGQSDVKRIVGYSGINQVGFILLGLCSGSGTGILLSSVYIIIYTLLNIVWIIMFRFWKMVKIEDLNEKGGLGMVLLLLSLAGIPPLGGFFIKYNILLCLAGVEHWFAVIMLIVGSMIGVVYYLRMVESQYLTPKKNNRRRGKMLGGELLISLGHILNIVFIFAQDYIWVYIGSM
jgi:NADH-quinone oxidoreductase subunit N